MFAYAYEFMHLDVLHFVWISSMLFLFVNISLSAKFARKFHLKTSETNQRIKTK
jgi:hypothetical protein